MLLAQRAVVLTRGGCPDRAEDFVAASWVVHPECTDLAVLFAILLCGGPCKIPFIDMTDDYQETHPPDSCPPPSEQARQHGGGRIKTRREMDSSSILG